MAPRDVTKGVWNNPIHSRLHNSLLFVFPSFYTWMKHQYQLGAIKQSISLDGCCKQRAKVRLLGDLHWWHWIENEDGQKKQAFKLCLRSPCHIWIGECRKTACSGLLCKHWCQGVLLPSAALLRREVILGKYFPAKSTEGKGNLHLPPR